MERGATESENKMVGSMSSLYKDTYYLKSPQCAGSIDHNLQCAILFSQNKLSELYLKKKSLF